eukprot:6181233-Pleurochrysis_carterae.AAC.1
MRQAEAAWRSAGPTSPSARHALLARQEKNTASAGGKGLSLGSSAACEARARINVASASFRAHVVFATRAWPMMTSCAVWTRRSTAGVHGGGASSSDMRQGKEAHAHAC